MIKSLNNIEKQEKEDFKIPRNVQGIIPIQRIWMNEIFLI